MQAASLLLAALAPSAPMDFTAFLKAELASVRAPSAAIAVVQDGKVLWSGAEGYASLELKAPASADTVYRLGSVTKQFTATLVLMLEKDGKLSVKDPARKWIDFLPAMWGDPTLENLLNHTSGIPNNTESPTFIKDMRSDLTVEEVVKSIADRGLSFPAGMGHSYSNTGYSLLGYVIEKASGKPYGEVLKEKILDPLGMSSTVFAETRRLVPNRAQGYQPDGAGWLNALPISMAVPGGAGAIESTVNDMAKWLLAQDTERLLPEADMKRLVTPLPLKSGKPISYAFGWSVGRLNQAATIEHGGAVPGFNSMVMRIPSKKLAIVVLVNCDGGASGRIAKDALAFVDPSLKEPEPQILADDNKPLTERLRKILDDLREGRRDADQFTDEVNKAITADMVKQASAYLMSLGPVEAFDLVKDEKPGEAIHRTYRVKASHGRFLFQILVRPDGKVASFGLAPL